MTEYQKQPTVLLNIVVDRLLLRGILDACRTLGWRGVNLAYTSNYIPSRQPPIGAIIDNAPTASTLAHIRNMGMGVCT